MTASEIRRSAEYIQQNYREEDVRRCQVFIADLLDIVDAMLPVYEHAQKSRRPCPWDKQGWHPDDEGHG